MKRASAAIAVLTLAAIVRTGAAAAAPPGPASCAALGQLSAPEDAFIQQTPLWHDASDPLGAHCEIVGDIDRRVGVNAQSYGIEYHLRLPVPWNGRFFYETQGGNDGALGAGTGVLRNVIPGNALAQGYATVSTDAGHENGCPQDPRLPCANNGVRDAGNDAAFGLDPRARDDYGYHAIDAVTTRSKQLIAAFYGVRPHHSYIMGCSNGGREAMVAADRFPDYFDGVVAGDPGFNLPVAALGEVWNNKAYAALATTTDTGLDPVLHGNPLLAPTFSPADLTLVANAVLKKCDALDGLVDGIVDNAAGCRVDLSDLQCPGAKTAACLSAQQVAALDKVVEGARTSSGRRVYSGFPLDAGIAAPGWRSWMLGSSTTTNDALNASFAFSHTYIFYTPPVQAQNPFGYELAASFDALAKLVFATSSPYTESSMDFMGATTDMQAFARRGGKMIIFHGNSDPVFSVKESVRWVREASARARGEDGKGKEFVRLFRVPGMNHCSGGPATDEFDALTPIVEWVEHGTAPARIDATARPVAANPAVPWPGRTRPLCPFPQQARYKGTGSIEVASSFSCRDVGDDADEDERHHGSGRDD